MSIGAALLASALIGCGAPATRDQATHGRPPHLNHALQQLHEERGQLLDGGRAAFRRRLADLRGVPVVVHQWASWCAACRAELALIADAADQAKDRFAVLGLNAQDTRPNAAAATATADLPYPQYFDIEAAIARSFGGGRTWPSTAYFSPDGDLVHLHPGAYRSYEHFQQELLRFAATP